MNLIDPSELLNVTNTNGFAGKSLANVLMSTLKFNEVNKVYAQNCNKNNLEFLEAILKDLEVKFDLNDYELNKLPEAGPFITVSNHPFGGIDGLLLMKIISMKRKDFKLFGNFLLERIVPLQDYILPVNSFESHKEIKSSVGSLKYAYRHLAGGHPLGIFPAGEVSSYDEKIVIQDRQWVHSTIRFIKNAQVPVIPIYFHGSNSILFHLLGMINPKLRTAKLASELFNKKNKKLTIRIGSPISVAEQNEFTNIDQYGRFLRAKTYALGSAIEVKKFYHSVLKKMEKPEKIVSQFNKAGIESEINLLEEKYLLFSSENYKVFCAPYKKIPLTLNEIGRLREITFREVGEGTNRSSDLDEFDLYYDHLFIWDDETKQIVGAYRVGKGKEITKQFGKKGFYINSLFKINEKMLPVLQQSIELGRSFVVKEYQKKPASLFLLWKGIIYVLLKNPEYRYLIGPVSISSTYSNFSKSLIIDFIKSNYFHPEYAQLIKPRNEFKVNYKRSDHNIMLSSIKDDISKLDRIIEDIEPSHYKMPILFKKYLKQNAKIIGFNIDPRFNEALDGLMILDLFDVPLNTIRSLSKELNDDSIMERFKDNIINY